MSVAIALTFAWLGLVVGLSFLEAPLKFRAAGILVALAAAGDLDVVPVAVVALVAVLLVQTVMLHGFMDKRAARIVAGESLPPSSHHYIYIGLEVLKVALLVLTGTLLLRELAG